MKSNKCYLWLIAFVIANIFSFGFASCSSSSSEDELPESKITVNGASSGEHTFPGTFDGGKSGIDYKQVFKINSNVEWTMSGKVDWLNISPTKGNGEVELTVYPTSENNSDEPREAMLVLSASDASVTIRIVQEGKFAVCFVLPANQVALYDRFCWEYTASPNVNTFQYVLLPEKEFKRLTNNELVEIVSRQDVLKYDDGYISWTGVDSYGNEINDNTNYYFVSLATDRDGNNGALKSVILKTPEFLDRDEDAYINYDNVEWNSYGFVFDFIKEGYCDSYHIVYGVYDEYINPSVFAFVINYYLKNNKKHWISKNDYYEWDIILNYPNNHTFTYTNYYMSYFPVIFGYGWGVFKNGDLSSDLLGFQYDTSSSDSPQMSAPRGSVNDELKMQIIKKSEFLERAKNMYK